MGSAGGKEGSGPGLQPRKEAHVSIHERPDSGKPAGPEGGADVFEALLIDVLPHARSCARYLTLDEAEADDLVQEAALLALANASSFRLGTNFRAWFIRILKNAFYMRLRRDRRWVTVSPDSFGFQNARSEWEKTGRALPGVVPLPAEACVTARETRQVLRAIARLPDPFRAVAELYFLDDLTYLEIAERLGCPVGTVRSRLHRARKALRACLWSLGEDHGLVPGREAPERAVM